MPCDQMRPLRCSLNLVCGRGRECKGHSEYARTRMGEGNRETTNKPSGQAGVQVLLRFLKSRTWSDCTIQQFYFWDAPGRTDSRDSDMLSAHIHSNITQNSQKVEATRVSINGRMENRSAVYPYHTIECCSATESITCYTCYNTGEP